MLSEVYPNPRGPAASWKPVPAIRSPVATATKFNLMELIHEVGLPIQTDAGRGLSSIVTDWQTLYDSSLTSGHVNHRPKPRDNLVWHQWRQLSDRRLVNERDTAFHSAVGGRLSSECETMGLARICLINNRRLLMKDFDDYVNGLRFGATIIGSDLWQLGHSGAASSLFSRQWLSDTTARKKDAGLICIISKARHYGGANAGAAGYYTSTTGATKEHRLSQVAGPSRALEILPPSFGRKAGPRLIAVVAHESAHSLRLLDEYASDCSHSAAPTTTFASNLQSRTELTTSGSFKGDDIKWLWPRIAKAGVLKDPPLPTVANEFIITLETGHAAPFGQGDEVRVRARPLPSNPIPSELFRIKSIHLGDSIEVVQISGFPAPNDLSIFPAESVLLAPVRVPGSAPNVADVKLVDDRIVEHINQTNGPLNAPQGNPTRDCQTAFDTDTNVPKLLVYPIQAARNLPPPLRTGTRKQPVYSSWIVGLYEGGQGMPCGIYHPTGVCLMRALQVPDRDRRGNPIPNAGNIYKFCPVCRYAMVDQIDPRKHEDIDVDYHAIYPQ